MGFTWDLWDETNKYPTVASLFMGIITDHDPLILLMDGRNPAFKTS